MRKLFVTLVAALALVMSALAVAAPAQATATSEPTPAPTAAPSPDPATDPLTPEEQAAADKAAAEKAAQEKAAKEKAAKEKAAKKRAAKKKAEAKARKKRAQKRAAQRALRTWNQLAHCESTSRWHVDTGNGYYGGLQISPGTWRAFGGKRFAGLPHQASKSEQIKIGKNIKNGQGWGAWPSCSRRLGLR